MSVKHGLAGVLTGVESEPEVTGGVLGGNLAAELHEVDQGLWVVQSEVGNVAVVVSRNDQNVDRLTRGHVSKSD